MAPEQISPTYVSADPGADMTQLSKMRRAAMNNVMESKDAEEEHKCT